MCPSDATETRRNILIVSPFYHPELISTGKANSSLGRELVAEGWNVEVICSHPLYPDWHPNRTRDSLPGHRFHRGGAWVRYTGNAFVRRILLELWFFFHCAVTLPQVSGEASVVVMVHPPSLFGLIVHAMLPRHVRRVVIVHDLQGEYARRGYHRGFRLLATLIHAVEKRCLRAADRCIFFSAQMAAIAETSYRLSSDRVAVAYPSVTIDPLTACTDLLASMLPADVRHVVYSGALGEKQNPRKLAALMDAAAKSLPNVHFHIFSRGPAFNDLQATLSVSSAVRLHDLVAEAQLPELYRRSTVQIVPQAPGSEDGSLPSKLPNLLALGVHILGVCAPNSEVAQLITGNGSGTVVSDWTEDGFLAGVRAALVDSARTSQQARRLGAAKFLRQCRVNSLAKLVIGEATRS